LLECIYGKFNCISHYDWLCDHNQVKLGDFTVVVAMNAIIDGNVGGHDDIGYGKVIVPSKCIMVFPCVTKVWTATFFPTLNNTKG
jgi:hypothetical protein